jgi:glycosyltransferase involved in cell wall biosynthesis
MKISVVIPTYNSAATIKATLDSVMAQTASPHEILVMDDGSTDNTLALLKGYEGRITIFSQLNQGVAQARNVLCRHVRGDLVAFLDHDDVWHPNYLAAQQSLFEKYPAAVAFFTGHENFQGYDNYNWSKSSSSRPSPVEIIKPIRFLNWYHTAPGPFVSMSFCCVPRKWLGELGDQPFCPQLSGVDDYHLLHLLLLHGPIIYDSTPLVAYRITRGAQSANLLKAVLQSIKSLELLRPYYAGVPDTDLRNEFKKAFASQRREFAKILMGTGRSPEARQQLRLSLKESSDFPTLAKSGVMLLLTCLPKRFQPTWPSEWKISHSQPC